MVGVKLSFPDKDTMDVVLSALRDTNLTIHKLTCSFNDRPFIETQELRESILIAIVSGNVNMLRIKNYCRVQEKHNQYFDFSLQCLSGQQQQQKTKRFGFSFLLPITLAEANRFSLAIASNENIKYLQIGESNVFQLGREPGIFREDGTFEAIFGAVLNNDAIQRFVLGLVLSSFKNTLSTNNTLNVLRLISTQKYSRPNVARIDEGLMYELANVLKINTGLQQVQLSCVLMNNVGRSYLLDSLPDNRNLLMLNTIHKEKAESPTVFGTENEEEIKERIILQSQINCSVKVNKIWNCCTNNKWKQLNELPVKTYPHLLESFEKKPLLFYLFLQEKNPLLFDDISERCPQPCRRCSMRVLKKRRITTKGASSATATSMSTSIYRKKVLFGNFFGYSNM